MATNLIDKVEEKHLKKEAPEFSIGDTVDVHVKIVEGDRERVQVFNGTVIARKGRGINAVFTVRRIVNNEGVERIFPLHSPNVVNVDVKRSGIIRRSKLFFLRERTGKSVRLREKWITKAKTEESN
jgi:large subunit ribosomal protein L19